MNDLYCYHVNDYYDMPLAGFAYRGSDHFYFDSTYDGESWHHPLYSFYRLNKLQIFLAWLHEQIEYTFIGTHWNKRIKRGYVHKHFWKFRWVWRFCPKVKPNKPADFTCRYEDFKYAWEDNV